MGEPFNESDDTMNSSFDDFYDNDCDDMTD